MSLAEAIKFFRKQKGFTQEDLAEKAFVTRQTVSSWETGRTRPDLETMKLISDALGTDLSEFNYGELSFIRKLNKRKEVLFAVVVLLVIVLSCVMLNNYYESDQYYLKKYSLSQDEMLHMEKEVSIEIYKEVVSEDITKEFLTVEVFYYGNLRYSKNSTDEVAYFPSHLHVAVPIGAKVFEDGSVESNGLTAWVLLPDNKKAEVFYVHLSDGRLGVLSRFSLLDSEGGSVDFLIDVSDYVFVDEDGFIQEK